MVAVKIGYPNKRKITVIGYYRQWNDLHIKVPKVRNIKAEAEKFKNMVSKWKSPLEKNNETLILGDINIPINSIDMEEHLKTNYMKTFNRMTKIFKEELSDNGLIALNEAPTFFRGEVKSCLDLQATNKPNKIKRAW